jgi:hypothetical protein
LPNPSGSGDQLQNPNDLTITMGLTHSVGTWEYTIFVGITAALFILYFGLVRTLTDDDTPPHFRVLLLPVLGLALLSLEKVFSTLRTVFPIPLFTGERVAARIISLAFVFILIMACAQFQRWLDKHRPSLLGAMAMLLLVVLAAFDLRGNLFLWSVSNAAGYYPVVDYDPALYFPANQYDDLRYIALLSAGLLVSLLSAAALLFLAWRERRKSQVAPQNNFVAADISQDQ